MATLGMHGRLESMRAALGKLGPGRARWLAAGVLALAALTLAWLLWVPHLVARAIERRLLERGFASRVTDVDVGPTSVVVTGLHVRSVRPGLVAEVTQAVASIAPLRGRVLDAVHVNGLTLQLDLDQPFARSWLERPASKKAASGSRAPSVPSIEAEGVALTVTDEAGRLVHGKGLRGHATQTSWKVRGERLEIGSAPGEVVALEGLEAQGTRDGLRPVLSTARVASALLRWADETTAASPDAFPAAAGRTRARLVSAISELRGARATAGASLAPARSRLFGPGAVIALENMRVVSGQGADAPEILRDLSVTVTGEPDDALRTRVHSAGTALGDIDLDLHVWPSAARVEGKVALQEVSLALFAPALPPLPFSALERTRVRANLSLQASGTDTVAARGEIGIRDLSFASEGLSRLPVGPFSLVARGEGTFTPARRELSLSRADFEWGEVRASGAGVVAWPAHGYRIEGQLELPKSNCQAVLDSVPSALLDELSTVQLAGQFGAKLAVHVDSADLDRTKVSIDVDENCAFTAVPPLLDLSRFEQPFMQRVLEPDDQIFEFETGPGSPTWTPIELISPFMVQAVVAHEDGRFLTHHGFAEPEIAVALARNLKARAFRFGASTITMQLVKNVFLHRDKLLSRKVQEAFITWWLEQKWDKRRILELYLNVIEYGPQVYGIRSAALHYFGTVPMSLTPAQSAFLASILPSPKKLHAQYDAGALTGSMQNRLAAFLKHMRARQRIDEDALLFGLGELEQFSFYRPGLPPPLPPAIRGTAQNPFQASVGLVDPWGELEADDSAQVEDGSFGP